MNEKIREYVESIFQDAPQTRRAIELKEELIANLLDRYTDLIAQGKDEEEAYAITIMGIGNVDELIRGLREQDVFNASHMQIQQQKSALLVSGAVALYIVSFIFPLIFSSSLYPFSRGLPLVGVVLMFLCWAGATMLLVYNYTSRPKYKKMDETIVEEFKEWKHGQPRKKVLLNSIQSMLWTLTVILYLCIGFFFNWWHPGWMIFLLAVVVQQVIRLVFSYMEVK